MYFEKKVGLDPTETVIGTSSNGNSSIVPTGTRSVNSIFSESDRSLSIFRLPPGIEDLFPNLPEIFDKKGIISELKDYYDENGKDANKTYEFLKSKINENKGNPKELKSMVDSLLSFEKLKYDNSKQRGAIADTDAEALAKMLTQDGEVHNSICTTIHGLVMETLNDCDIPAVLDTGNADNKCGHTTLIYQLEKGKYIWNNYGESTEVKADNIIDASKIIHKQSEDYSSRGNVSLTGSGDKFYKEYEYKDEAAFGNLVDKSNSDSEGVFGEKKESGNSIQYGVDKTASSLTYDVSLNKAGKDGKTQGEMAVEYKESDSTTCFDSSKSVGLKLSGNKQKDDLNLEGGVILSTLQGKINENSSVNPEQTINQNLIKESIGASYTPEIYKKNDLSISAGVKATEAADFNLNLNAPDADGRINVDAGIKANYKTPKVDLTATTSVGVLADGGLPDYKTQNLGFSFGYKANAGIAATYKPTNNVDLSTAINGYYSKTPVLEHVGASGDARVSIKTDDQKAKFYAGISDEFYKKHLDIGLFDENIAFSNTVTAYGGVNVNNFDFTGSLSQTTNNGKTDKKASLAVKYNY